MKVSLYKHSLNLEYFKSLLNLLDPLNLLHLPSLVSSLPHMLDATVIMTMDVIQREAMIMGEIKVNKDSISVNSTVEPTIFLSVIGKSSVKRMDTDRKQMILFLVLPVLIQPLLPL